MCGFTVGRAAYYKEFPVVEVQQTFYDPPARETLTRWRIEAPAGFEFTMKAWQVITHLGTSQTYRRLKLPFSEKQKQEAGAFRATDTVFRAWERTRDCAHMLRASAILFQCPASFRATDDNVTNMHVFFDTVGRPEGVKFMWEPRGPWPDDIVAGLCRDLELIHAVDPFVRPSLTPELLYWRLHGNRSHYARYTDEELRQIEAWFPKDQSVECYVMFNNVPRVKDIERFRALGIYPRTS